MGEGWGQNSSGYGRPPTLSNSIVRFAVEMIRKTEQRKSGDEGGWQVIDSMCVDRWIWASRLGGIRIFCLTKAGSGFGLEVTHPGAVSQKFVA